MVDDKKRMTSAEARSTAGAHQRPSRPPPPPPAAQAKLADPDKTAAVLDKTRPVSDNSKQSLVNGDKNQHFVNDAAITRESRVATCVAVVDGNKHTITAAGGGVSPNTTALPAATVTASKSCGEASRKTTNLPERDSDSGARLQINNTAATAEPKPASAAHTGREGLRSDKVQTVTSPAPQGRKKSVKPCTAPPPPPPALGRANNGPSVIHKDTCNKAAGNLKSQSNTAATTAGASAHPEGVSTTTTCQSIPPSQHVNNSSRTVAATKPAILSPKPGLHHHKPQPVSAASQPKQAAPSAAAAGSVSSKQRDESSPRLSLKDAPNEFDHETQSDLSDVMRDVLSIFDRQTITSDHLQLNNAAPDVDEMNDAKIATESCQISDKESPEMMNQSSLVNNDTNQDDTAILSGENASHINHDQTNRDITTVSAEEIGKTNDPSLDSATSKYISSELRIDIPAVTPSAVERKPLTPAGSRQKRRVRRHKTTLGLLCCGLGRRLMRDQDSPPYELPLRTEGTQARSKMMPGPVSQSCDVISVSHSPKQLQQSDVTNSHQDVRRVQDDIRAHDGNAPSNNHANADVDVAASGSTHKQNTTKPVKDKTPATCNSAANHESASKQTPINGVTSSYDAHSVTGVAKPQTSSPANSKELMDVLCKSEKPIEISIKDNKDLVVVTSDTRSTTSPANRHNIDVTQRPVVRDVKLMKSHKHSANISPPGGAHSGSSTPRSSKSFVFNPAAADQQVVPPTNSSSQGDAAPEDVRNSSCSSAAATDPATVPPQETFANGLPVTTKPRSQSVEDLTNASSCGIVDLGLVVDHLKREDGYRSSFIGRDATEKKAIIKQPGEVQTLLKHSKVEGEVYALPQPACYSDDTLRAVKLITNKYDTLERWKIRAVSFRSDDGMRRNIEYAAGKLTGINRQSSNEKSCDDVAETSSTVATASDVTHSSVNNSGAQLSNDDGDQNSQTLDEPDRSQQEPPISTATGVAQNYDLSSEEISRITLFYSSRETQVTVGKSIVDLLLSVKEVERASDVTDWSQSASGVPVLVLTTGDGRSRRELTLVVAERDTSFPLWQDTINHLSQYQALTPQQHTMQLSRCHLRMAAFRFHSAQLASQFMQQFRAVTKNPNDDLWKVCVQAKKSNKKKDKRKYIKGDISQPIQFNHVTNVSVNDRSVKGNLTPQTAESSINEIQSHSVVVEFNRPRSNSLT